MLLLLPVLGWADDLSVLDELNFDEGLVEVQPANVWKSIVGPIALTSLFFMLVWFFWKVVPFKAHKDTPLIHHYPTGIQRGLAMAVVFYGIAFAFGALEALYQVNLHGSGEEYFANMSQGKLIAFTHAHLFGFTTSFLIIGVPFTLNFAHNRYYQWLLPIGLNASFIDVASWWGIKYLSPNFEYVSIFCGAVFSLSYLFMLIGMLRVILFPRVRWYSDRPAS